MTTVYIGIGSNLGSREENCKKAIQFLKSCSLQIGIVSNGSGMDKIDSIAGLLNKKDWVRLSLDAGKDQTFQRIHHPRINTTLDQITAKVKIMLFSYKKRDTIINKTHVMNPT